MNQDYSNLYAKPRTSAPVGMQDPLQPAEPPRPFAMRSTDVPPSPHAVPPQYMRPAPSPVPPKPKAPFSPIPLLLMAGVAFLFLGGVLVLRQTWSTLADSVRAVILLLFSLMFFGANLLAEKVFRLPKTGLAFYILGSIFLPLSVAGIGVFELFGEWFSFTGDGRCLVGAAICGCVAVTGVAGTLGYKNPFLAWMSLCAAAGAVLFTNCFLIDRDTLSVNMKLILFTGVYTAFNILSLCGTEYILRTKPGSPCGKAVLVYLYPLMIVTSLIFSVMALLVKGSSPAPAAAALLVLTACFFYPRFDKKFFHFGSIGMAICLIGAFGALTRTAPFTEVNFYGRCLFVLDAAALLLMSFRWIPKLSDSLRRTAPLLGCGLTIPLLFSGSTICFVDTQSIGLFVMHALMILGTLFFLISKKNNLPDDAGFCALTATVVYVSALVGTAGGNMPAMQLLLVIAAVLLTVQAFLGQRLWCFILAGCAAAGMLILPLAHNTVWILWICTAVTLGGVIYAHIAKRPLLEKSFAWSLIASLLPAVMSTLTDVAELGYSVTLVLVFAVLTLLYLLETTAFPTHERVQGTKLFLELLSFISAFAAMVACLIDDMAGNGFYLLLAILIGVFVVCFVTKRINYVVIPHLIMFYVTVRHLITQITAMQLTAWEITAPGTMSMDTLADLMQIGCNILLLAVLALTGRLLLPKFLETGENLHRLDLPLLTGILVIISTVTTLDWYPAMLFCLLMCVYSLLFIGRLDNRYIPALLASLFGCLTLLFHNICDPFGLLEKLSVLDIKTLPIMLYLLPAHLFILSLLVILPEKCRNGIHIARFVMYCITMLTLLSASMYFKNVTDALVLVVFSFLILAGSFIPKRLRWFVLGFAVLVFMTIRLTWSFWKSLHWGIYLFLAGILLIVIASLYEYSARYAREHPGEPKKKFQLFAAWKW